MHKALEVKGGLFVSGSIRPLAYGFAVLALLAGGAGAVQAQSGVAMRETVPAVPAVVAEAVPAHDDLPDAPDAASSSLRSSVSSLHSSAFSLSSSASGNGAGEDEATSQTVGTPGSSTPRVAGRYDTVILPGQTAARLTVHDKVLFGVKDSISPFSAAGWVLSAAYEQVTDGSPNYGVLGNTQTGKSFAQRLGAAAARDTSETIFSESILAPILHEDPRYYAQTNRNFFYRVFYAGTRPIFTRTDGGKSTINLSQLGGNLAGSALTPAYYPAVNRPFSEVLRTFGGSVGGSAVGDLASEFLPGLLEAVHFKKKQ